MNTLPEWAYLWLEFNVLALFFLHLVHAWRRGLSAFFQLLSAALFGYILEQGDIAIFHTYAYNPDLHGFIGFVPLILPMAWAMIIYGAMLLTDRLGLVGRAAPFADALWAVLLDLGFDAIAIRMGLWHWNIRLDQGYFGVPAGNFYSWIFVAFSFSLFTRLMRSRWPTGFWRQWLAPFLAYPTFMLSLVPFILVSEMIYDNPAPQGLGIELVSITLVVFAVIIARSFRHRRPLQAGDFLTSFTRFGIHLTFLGGYLWLGLQSIVPFLLFFSLVLLSVEVLLAFSLHSRQILLASVSSPIFRRFLAKSVPREEADYR